MILTQPSTVTEVFDLVGDQHSCAKKCKCIVSAQTLSLSGGLMEVSVSLESHHHDLESPAISGCWLR